MELNTLSYLGAIQGFLIFIFLATRNQNRKANFFLAVYILMLSCQSLLFAIGLKTTLGAYRIFNSLFHVIPYLHGPLIYLYVLFLIQKNEKISFRHSLHGIPFMLFLFISSTAQYYGSNSLILWFKSFVTPHAYLDHLLYDLFKIASILLYGIAVGRIITRYKEKLSSKADTTLFSWINQLVYFSIIVVTVVSLMLNLSENIQNEFQMLNSFLFLVVSLFIYWITYKAVTHKLPLLENATLQAGYIHPSKNDKYSKSSLTEIEAQDIMDKLNDYMQSEKAYLDTALSLDKISSKLKVYKHHLSQAVNQQTGKNLYAYINEFRIRQAIEELKKERQPDATIEDIAFESGFSSKSTFNSLFKAVTGMTPSAFVKKNSLS